MAISERVVAGRAVFLQKAVAEKALFLQRER